MERNGSPLSTTLSALRNSGMVMARSKDIGLRMHSLASYTTTLSLIINATTTASTSEFPLLFLSASLPSTMT